MHQMRSILFFFSLFFVLNFESLFSNFINVCKQNMIELQWQIEQF